MSIVKSHLIYRILIVGMCGLLGALGIFDPTAFAQNYVFGRADFTVGEPGRGPGAVATGDFNGDGIPDLAVTLPTQNHETSAVSILLGKTDGTFQPGVEYQTAGDPGGSSVAVGDFNRDGKLDLAVVITNCPLSCGLGSVSVLLGNGDGTFQPAVSDPTGTEPDSVRVGDFNGDGKLDLAVANTGSNNVSILLGNGDGTFQPHIDYATGSLPRSLQVRDFNGDGKLDLAVITADNSPVSILLGKGDGTFQPYVAYPAGTADSLATGDFDGDGKVDLVTANGDNTVSILLGNGDGTFRAPVEYPAGATYERIPVGIIAADFNGDGKLDLAVDSLCTSGNLGSCSTSGSVSILLGKGDGTFPTHVEYATGDEAGAVIVGDFNGDGKLDLVFPNNIASTVSVLLGRGNGTFHDGATYATGTGSRPNSMAAADFNGDRMLDLAVANSGHNTVSILLGNCNGTFRTHVDYAAGSLPSSVATGDFDSNGRPDLAVANTGSNNVSILLGNGDGTFRAHVDYATGAAPSSIAIGDFNGDGKLDLAVANSNCPSLPSCGPGSVSILLGNGDGTFRAHVDYATGAAPSSIAIGDFNGDGKLDLAVANYHSFPPTVSILLGKGDGTFQPHVDYLTRQTPDSLAVGDFNGDGKLDLAAASFLANTVSVLFGNGDGTFRDHIDFPTGDRPASMMAGDFNGDGTIDLAVADSGGDTVSIMLGQSDGGFSVPIDFIAGSVPSSLAAGDFDGDGSLDLAVTTSGGGVSILLNYPGIALFPTKLSFGQQRVGTTSAPKSVLLSDPSAASLRIGITITGANASDFAQTHTCGGKVLPGADCTISVTFKPTATGTRTASLTISDNALARKQMVPLTAVGTTP